MKLWGYQHEGHGEIVAPRGAYAVYILARGVVGQRRASTRRQQHYLGHEK
jgi:hypothetical protein